MRSPGRSSSRTSTGHCRFIRPVEMGASIQALGCLLRRVPKSALQRDRNGCNALHFVEPRSSFPAVEYLVRQHPQLLQDKNVYGQLCVHSAAEAGAKVDILRFLAEQYPQALDEYDFGGYLPVHLLFGPDACLERGRLFVEMDQHFNVGENHPQGGLTLHYAVRLKSPLYVIEYFYEMWPESIQVQDQVGRCPLFHHFDVVDGDELDYGSDEVKHFLIRKWRHSVYQRDHDRNTVLHHAVRSRATLAAVKLLVKLWSDSVWTRNRLGCLPLHGAIDQDEPSLKIVKILVRKAPATLLERDTHGRFPIQIAIDRGLPREIIQLLAAHAPPPVQVEDEDCRTSPSVSPVDTVHLLIDRSV